MRRHVEAECLGGLEVNNKLELDRGLDWKLARSSTLEDAIDIRRRTPKIIDQVISVGQQAADCSELTVWINGWEAVAGRQRCDLYAMGIRERIRHHDQATIWLASLCGNNGFELGHVANRCSDRLNAEGRSGGFEGFQPIFEICRRCRVEHEGYPVDSWRNLFEQLQPLAGHRGLHSDETSDVSSRPRKARDEAAADRIGNECEDDGNGACLLQHRRGNRGALRDNEVGLQRDEFLRKSMNRLDVAGCRPAGVDPNITTLGPPELLKSLPQRRDAGLP